MWFYDSILWNGMIRGLGKEKLKVLFLSGTQIADDGCAALAAALDSGAFPALEYLFFQGTQASAAAKATVRRAGLVVDV